MDHNLRNIFTVITLAVIAFLVMGLFGYMLYYFSEYSESGKEAEIEAQMQLYQGMSRSYYARLGFYSGLCEEGIKDEYLCRANDEGFVIYTRFQDRYYCTDATSFTGVVTSLPSGLVCSQ